VRAPLPLPAAASISMQGCYSVGRMGEIADRRLLEDDGCDVRTAATVRVGVILVLTYQNQGFLIGQEFGRGMENYYHSAVVIIITLPKTAGSQFNSFPVQ
jgi:hypothetical protein